jgi:glycine/D-amino acid oxidase-like deaminating enzyme
MTRNAKSAATVTRDLRTGEAVWTRETKPRVPTVRLARDARCDVLIVGAGISGALVADALSDAGLNVLIVDRRRSLAGSTSASTALLQYEIDTPLSNLARKIGKPSPERIWQRSRLALDALRERTRHLGIDAGCINRDSLYLEGDVLDVDGLRAEGQARRAAGFEVSFLSRSDVQETYGIRRRAALLGFDSLAVNPVQLAAGFLRAALSRGTCLSAETEIVDVKTSRTGIEAATAHGPTIHARNLIFATGYEFPKSVPMKGHQIISTWAIATVAQPRRIWPTGCFIWEASDPYLYLRPGPDGTIICGGEDEEFSDATRRDEKIPIKTERLRRKLAALFPDRGLDMRVQHAWCGSFGASNTGTPTIGAIPGMAGCFAVLGYGGNGITFSMLAAQLLRTTLTGGVDQDAALFAFTSGAPKRAA